MTKLDELRTLVRDGLATDGGHHKQWYLWRIAEIVLSPVELDEFKLVWADDEGIAP